MDRLIYTAMTGAGSAANRQASLAHNLANASTNGFRAQLDTFRAVPVRGDGATTRVMAAESTAGFSDRAGPATRTGRNLDAMPTGNHWFTVQGLDGNEAYTRNGQFEVTQDGTLVTGSGLPVLSNGGAPITVPPGAQVTIGDDGSVSAKIGNQPANVLGRLKMARQDNENPLRRSEDGLFRTASGDPLQQDDNARLQVGVLEGSNVNPIETMVGMIEAARQFESNMKMLQSVESNDRNAAQLLSMQG